MPTKKASTPTSPDHRIFGFDQRGQLRANFHNGPASYAPGALYSWIVSSTVQQLSDKLAEQWEQPLSDAEWDTLEEIEASMSEVEMDCDDCGGSGVDPGGLNPHEPEACRTCHGSGHITLASFCALQEETPAKRIPAAAVSSRKERVA